MGILSSWVKLIFTCYALLIPMGILKLLSDTDFYLLCPRCYSDGRL
jgi:hypothetical protein